MDAAFLSSAGRVTSVKSDIVVGNRPADRHNCLKSTIHAEWQLRRRNIFVVLDGISNTTDLIGGMAVQLTLRPARLKGGRPST